MLSKYLEVNYTAVTLDIWFLCPLTTCLALPLGDAAAFDEEWRREAGRYAPPNTRAMDYGRDRRAGGQQLALTAPPSSTSPPGHRHESPRHRQPHTRPRYDWWEVRESRGTEYLQFWVSCRDQSSPAKTDVLINGYKDMAIISFYQFWGVTDCVINCPLNHSSTVWTQEEKKCIIILLSISSFVMYPLTRGPVWVSVPKVFTLSVWYCQKFDLSFFSSNCLLELSQRMI